MAEHEAAGDPETEHWPAVVWLARLSVYFLAQGALALLAYAYYGFGSDPNSFALGFRIDPILAAINLVWGLIGTYIGFFNPRYATASCSPAPRSIRCSPCSARSPRSISACCSTTG